MQAAPRTCPTCIEVAAKLTKDLGGPYGIGVRGSRSWATIHPGFLSGYANYGQKDFTVDGGKLKAAMNTKVSKDYHKMLVKMIQNSGPKNWSTYTWYQVGTDLGAGASATIFDADILGYFMDGGDNKEAGQSRLPRFRRQPGSQGADAERLDLVAGDELLRQAEGRGLVLHAMGVLDRARHVRRAQDGLRQSGPRLGVEGRGVPRPHRQVLHRLCRSVRRPRRPARRSTSPPQPLFFDVTTQWAETLQKMVAKEVPVDEGLDQLAASIDKQLKDAGLG